MFFLTGAPLRVLSVRLQSKSYPKSSKCQNLLTGWHLGFLGGAPVKKNTLYFYQQVRQMFHGVLAIRKNYKPLFLHILSETQWWMSCRVTGGKAFEQMLAPNLRRGVKSDQCEEKG